MAQGSITKHVAKNGTVSYHARIDGGMDPATGKRRQQMRTFPIKREAQTWLRDEQRRIDRDGWAEGRKVTLKEWTADWLATTGTRGRRETTLITYGTLLRKHVVPALGHVTLAKLTPVVLEHFLHEQEQALKPASVQLLYAALRVVLADAVRLNLLVSNPLARVKPPQALRMERPSWTPAEARRFLEHTGTGEEHVFWLLFLASGARIGEVLAMRWGDLDLDRRQLRIQRTLTQTRAGIDIGDTTKSGKARTVPLSAPLCALLREQRSRVADLAEERAELWEHQDLLFPGPTGCPRNSNAVRTRLKALCTAAAVPALTPHGLRHTAASMLAEHAPAAVVRDVLGHSTVAITDGYLHAGTDAQQAGADALMGLLLDV